MIIDILIEKIIPKILNGKLKSLFYIYNGNKEDDIFNAIADSLPISISLNYNSHSPFNYPIATIDLLNIEIITFNSIDEQIIGKSGFNSIEQMKKYFNKYYGVQKNEFKDLKLMKIDLGEIDKTKYKLKKIGFKIDNDTFHTIISNWFKGNYNSTIPKRIIYTYGTEEWCNKTHSTHENCEYGCRYCWGAVLGNRIKSLFKYWDKHGESMILKNNWKDNTLDQKEKYTIFYAGRHDLPFSIIPIAEKQIDDWLKLKNVNILIVTKANWKTIEYLTQIYKNNKDRIEFRITITTDDPEQIVYWEGNSPSFEERMKCLKYLYENGFTTSVACEPMLINIKKDINSQIIFIKKLMAYVTNEIWIGEMNHIPRNKFNNNNLSEYDKSKSEEIIKYYSDNNIATLVHELYEYPKIKFKESIRKHIIKIIREGIFEIFNPLMEVE